MSDDVKQEIDSQELKSAIANAIATPAGRAVALRDRTVTYGDQAAVTNFKGDKMARWAFVSRCLGPECRDGKQLLGQGYKLKYYYVTAIDQENEATGEMEPSIYVVLWDGESAPVGYWSPYIARDLSRMIEALGGDDWPDGVAVKVVESNKPGKRAFYGLVPA